MPRTIASIAEHFLPIAESLTELYIHVVTVLSLTYSRDNPIFRPGRYDQIERICDRVWRKAPVTP